MTFINIANKIINIVFPKTCLNCKSIISMHDDLCNSCKTKIDFLFDNYCISCGATLPNEIKLCAKCVCDPPPFTMLQSVFSYNDFTKNMIFNLKFFDKTSYIKTYALWMYNKNRNLFNNVDIIIPIPLHRKRLFHRKYNQSAILAKAVSKLCEIPVEMIILKRTRNTLPQFRLTTKQREKNIKGAFTIVNASLIKNKTIIIVDDVVTTGVTAKGCAKTLLNYGAKEVRVLTLGRTLLH